MSNHCSKHCRAVFSGVSQQTSSIQRRSKSDHAETGWTAIGWLNPCNTSKSSWFANRPARISTRDNRCKPSSYSCGGAAGRSPRNGVDIPRIVDSTECRIFIARTHCEFVTIEFTQAHHAGTLKLTHNRGIKGTHISLKHATCSGR